jgi:hypothetical protein
MNIKTAAISSFARFIMGGDVFSRLINIIKRQQDKSITGHEKRQAAFEEVKIIGIEITDWAINLGIELAVAWVRSQSKK